MHRDVTDSLNTEGVSDTLGEASVGRTLVRLDALPQRAPIDLEAVLDSAQGDTAGLGAAAGDGADALIVYRDGDDVRVWLNVCPHAGRRLDWAPGKFLVGKGGSLICAAHGATFETKRGECIAGPCKGQSLRAIPVVVIDGEVRMRSAP